MCSQPAAGSAEDATQDAIQGATQADMLEALRTRALTPVFQPVLDLDTGALRGFEVLARWRHERLGPVPPAEFLPILRHAGMIAPFTRHMVATACAAAATWSGDFWLAFNLEPMQLLDPDLPDLLAAAVSQAGFPARRVVLEVTEEAFAAGYDQASLVAGRLVASGFGLCLADVGQSGTLRAILSQPFGMLKLDRTLARATTERADAARCVQGLVGLAGGLGMAVVATRIETAAQAERLRGLGCSLGQGWLFGEGLPAAKAGGTATSLRSLQPVPPAVAAGAEAACAVLAEMLDGLGLALCLFDEEDRALLWNRTFLDFFPEHRGHVTRGEAYHENLQRFYDARLHGEERGSIGRYIADGIMRHRTQSRPFSFHHRGRRLRVASLPLPGLGRARIWQDGGEAGVGAEEDRPEAASPGSTSPGATSPGAMRPVRAVPGSLRLASRLADGFAALDQTDRVTFANQQFLRLYDAASLDQVTGLTLAEIVRRAWERGPPDAAGRPPAARRDCDVIDNARFAGAPFEIRMPGGQWRRVVEQRDPDGCGHSIHSDITALKAEQQELRATRELLRTRNTELAILAGTDGLTGLANRRRFGERLAEAWSRSAADRTLLALLLIDVDHFKAVNDRFGHPGGDDCLRQVAASVSQIVRRPDDLVARYGGEEFVIILPDADGATALAVAERVRIAIMRDQAEAFGVTVSIGCVSVQPGTGRVTGSTELIERADAALYRAKAKGRNRVETA